MTEYDDEIERLRLFIEKVERVQSLSLVRTLVETGSKLTLSWTQQSGALQLAAAGPDAEQIDAFVLTMRLFTQDNDRISLRNMSKVLENLPVSEELNRHFAMHRSNLNQSLDSPCMLSINGDHPTRLEVLNTVLYGHLSHVSPDHRRRHLSWVQDPMAASIIDFEFVGVLVLFLKTLVVMAEICRRAVTELQATPATSGDLGPPGRG